MKRVMVVDDEMLVRMGLRALMDWEQHGFTIVDEAKDGEDALAKIPISQPHIILTDLVMAPMDGLQLIEICKKQYPNITVIVLSNYNDFDHVKQAMLLGAKDFLFKATLTEEVLLPVLESAIGQRASIAEKEEYQDGLLQRNIHAVKQRIIQMLVKQTYTREDDVVRELEFVNVAFDFTKKWIILLITIIDADLIVDHGEDETLQYAQWLEKIINETRKSERELTVFCLSDEQILVFYPTESDTVSELQYSTIAHHFQKAESAMRQYCGVQIVGVLSRVHNSIDDISTAVAACQKAHIIHFFHKNHQLLKTADLPEPGQFEVIEQFNPTRWKSVLCLECWSGIKEFIEAMFDWLHSLAPLAIAPVAIRDFLHTLYGIVKVEAMGKGVDLSLLLDEYDRSLYQAIAEYPLLTLIEDSFLAICKQYIEEKQGRSLRLTGRLVKVGIHVRNNLDTRLTVSQVANLMNMSKSHFSHIFKAGSGMTFVEYINEERIRRAEELLRSSDLMISEIAQMVGIQNQNYFSILFKKLRKITPQEYRAGKTPE